MKRLFLLLVLITFTTISYCQTLSVYEKDKEIIVNNVNYSYSDSHIYGNKQIPYYPDFFEYLVKNLRYPVTAVENGIQGNVYVTFYVERDGSLSDIHVTSSVDPSLSGEALRVIERTKSWIPGKVDGKVVRTEYTKVIRFRLR